MKVHIIDGYGIAFRGFYAFPSVINKNGVEVGGLIGFVKMISNLFKRLEPSHVIVAFDIGKSFRSEMYIAYKANRKKASPEIYQQLPFLRNVCDLLSIKYDEKIGYEADDLIASYAHFFSKECVKSVVVSSDKDLHQLIDDFTIIFDPIKLVNIDLNVIKEKFNIDPSQLVEVQALTGDASDNIPGVSGVGPKTALKLVQKHYDLEGIFANIDEICAQKALYKSLQTEKDIAFLSRKLATLRKDVSITHRLDEVLLHDHIDTKTQKCIEYIFNIKIAK